eukprot:6270839-Alexandrium_andersonii.AAC.1
MPQNGVGATHVHARAAIATVRACWAGFPLEQKQNSLSAQPGQRWRRRQRKYESAGSRKNAAHRPSVEAHFLAK